MVESAPTNARSKGGRHERLVSKGYWNRTEEAGAALPGGGWYRTGDAGYVDIDSYLFLVDRIQGMTVSGGGNVYSTEVGERAVRTPPCSRRLSSVYPTTAGANESTPWS